MTTRSLFRTYSMTRSPSTPSRQPAQPITVRDLLLHTSKSACSAPPALIEGAVGLLSTVPDYLRFSQMLLNKGELDGVRLLRATTVETITRNRLSDAEVQARGSAAGWGLANVEVIPGGEYGWDGTAGTIFWIDPDKQTAMVLMTASQPSNPGLIRERFKLGWSRP